MTRLKLLITVLQVDKSNRTPSSKNSNVICVNGNYQSNTRGNNANTPFLFDSLPFNSSGFYFFGICGNIIQPLFGKFNISHIFLIFCLIEDNIMWNSKVL